MVNGDVMHIDCGILSNCKEKNEIMNSAGKWMDLEKILLSGIV